MDVYSKEKRSEVMSKVPSTHTGPELLVRKQLHSLGIRFRLHREDLPGKPDIVLPKYGSVVFVHGCFWHHHKGCKKSKMPTSNVEFWDRKIGNNVKRDRRNAAALRRLGWRVLVIWECQIRTGAHLSKLARFLRGSKLGTSS